jgi:hypothetical protein
MNAEGLNQKSLLVLATLAAKWETPPKDALDTLILRCPIWHPDYQNRKAQLQDEKMAPKDIEKDLGDKIGEIILDELKVALDTYIYIWSGREGLWNFQHQFILLFFVYVFVLFFRNTK